MERIGLIPAAGFASRIGPLPCSKEIFPIGFQYSKETGEFSVRVACHSLLEKMVGAGIDKCYIVIRPEKWDIPSLLLDGKQVGIDIAYLVVKQTRGAPFTIDHAFPFVKDRLILFGFPDIVFGPEDAFLRLIDRQQHTNSDIVLGLYRAHQPHKVDMVEFDSSGKIREILIKPSSSSLEYTWIIAVWTNAFTQFLHAYLSGLADMKKNRGVELHIGDAVRQGMREGLSVGTEIFPDDQYVDIGTPEDLIGAMQENTRGLEGK